MTSGRRPATDDGSPMSQTDSRALIAELRRIAYAAGDVIMGFYDGGTAVRAKADASPVTDADEAAERLIVDALRALAPDIPVAAEEMAAAGELPALGRRFWLVDPLDGTKEFISRNGEFTVNIALIEDGRPTLGIVTAPAIGVGYTSDGEHAFVERGGRAAQPIAARAPAADGLVAAVSRSHMNAATTDYLAGHTIVDQRAGGSSLKFCLVAEGVADIYPRLGRTMEWDTAAGHAVVAAAGGSVRRLDGGVLTYGKPGLENPSFVVRGRDAVD